MQELRSGTGVIASPFWYWLRFFLQEVNQLYNYILYLHQAACIDRAAFLLPDKLA